MTFRLCKQCWDAQSFFQCDIKAQMKGTGMYQCTVFSAQCAMMEEIPFGEFLRL